MQAGMSMMNQMMQGGGMMGSAGGGMMGQKGKPADAWTRSESRRTGGTVTGAQCAIGGRAQRDRVW